MQLKIKPLRFTTRALLILAVLNCFTVSFSQEIIEDKPVETKKDTVINSKRMKADGVAAVVGEYILLDSDLEKEIDQIKAQGGDLSGISRCELFGSMLEQKLYAQHAIQDSITVNELQLRSQVEQQINYFVQESKMTIDELVKFYRKKSEEDLRETLYETNKLNYLSSEMRNKIIEKVEITPEEVRQFYNELKGDDELPTFGTELQIAQIVVIPEVTEAAKEDAINRLKQYKKEVEEGASFTTKVLFYSEDSGSKSTGGKYTLNRKRPQMVKEFRDVAFSLQEGEISEPFETDFGYHIILLEKIRGQEYDVRHILLRPELTQEAIQKAKDEIDMVRSKIVDGTVTFDEAAKEFSDEKETKDSGGKLINPQTQDYNFELTKLDPEFYVQVQDLKETEVSPVLQDQDRVNRIKFKIMKVANRTDEHLADFAKDYLKIKQLALQSKQFEAIAEWQDKAILDTYIKINGGFRNCEFNGNWLKKEQ